MPCASLQRKRVEFQKSSSEIQQLLLKLGFICDNDDPVGNITQIDDNAQQTIYFNGSVVSPSQKFEYNALYRLLKSTGREHVSINASSEPEAEGYNQAQISPQDGSAMRNYVREWQYDSVGNILSLIHNANGNAWTRSYDYASDNNRLSSTTVGQTTVNYTYNAHGSMTSMPHLQSMQWDFAEKLSHITRGTTEAYYNYDGGGQRIRKVVEKNGVTETRLYLGGFEIWRKTVNGVLDTERETLHVMDDKKRIAIVETLTVDNAVAVANPVPVQRYQLDNHLGSASLELDDSANIVSYEEYYPYGETSYRARRTAGEVSQKRYRYTGKEKDEESGLYYHGARYYACWLGRWTAADPAGMVDGVNLYMYVRGNPVRLWDPSGMAAALPECDDQIDYNLPNQDVKALPDNPTLGGMRGNASGFFSPDNTDVAISTEKLGVNHNVLRSVGSNPKLLGSNVAIEEPDPAGYYAAGSMTRYVGFALRHPIAASEIGEVKTGRLNISTISARFAASIDLKENETHEGSQVNAFRHVLWQATLAAKFDNSVAAQAGNAHEDNPFALRGVEDPTSQVFSSLSSADESIDLLNNRIGREIGSNNSGLDQKQLAQKTLDYFRDNGLWLAVSQSNGTYKISQEKLTTDEYAKSNENLSSRNQFGYTSEQWNKLKNKK